ncbi:hypothetical protein E2C01_094129 [Portunus trituberculatus]|uniref:Uncharacterized protein n=1 Tax=Portunus trituberculatus TaxID=210409 RepID=A0A5B7K0S4_PORTR|nr:hypothetical protein [Portunus trituberculatus]
MKQPEAANNQLGAGKSRRVGDRIRKTVVAKPKPEHRRLAPEVEWPETSIH